MNIKQAEKYIRDSIRSYGLVFKQHPYISWAYQITDRKTKEVIIDNATLGGTLNNLESGYLSCYDKDVQDFDKEQVKRLVIGE